MTKVYRIYGKHKDQSRFKPMDLSEGIQVVNLIKASLVEETKITGLMEQLTKNKDWVFDAREVAL